MFGQRKPVEVKKEAYVVFIALEDGEGIPEHCESRDEMMKKYFKYTSLIKTEKWLPIDDATINVEIIRYIRWVVQ